MRRVLLGSEKDSTHCNTSMPSSHILLHALSVLARSIFVSIVRDDNFHAQETTRCNIVFGATALLLSFRKEHRSRTCQRR